MLHFSFSSVQVYALGLLARETDTCTEAGLNAFFKYINALDSCQK